uniref:U1-type domain-containing protein n=1 Tax=Sander lucioperca TaxID=283035 RepID=A0A8D0DDQ5_SANLU
MWKRVAPDKPTVAKKLRNSELTAKYRADQYPNDYYESGQGLFYKFCQHTVDWTRKDTCNDHLKSKAHLENKAKSTVGKSLQVTTEATPKSIDARREFVEDFVAVCAEADIPLEKMKRIRPFLVKPCKQGGALPENASSLRQTHLPPVFDQHTQKVLQENLRCRRLNL